MAMVHRDVLTPKESAEMEYARENLRLQIAHTERMKEMDIEVAKLEARFSSWLRLPIMVLKLPVLVLLGVGYCIDRIRGNEPSDSFWQMLK